MTRTVSSVAALLCGLFALAPAAFATVPPTMQLLATGNGDQVQVTVHGDPNASVLLSYIEVGSGPQIAVLGTTDSSGTFTTTISSGSYGLASGTAVTALVGGTNGAKSPTESWPTVAAASTLTLSQSAVVVNAGSSASLTATNAGSGALYVSSNANPSIANVSLSGSQVTITGNTAGSTTVTLCTVGSTSNCPSLHVTVLPSGTAPLTISQTRPTVVPGQNLPITISGGNGQYLIQNNSDASTIQASISGSVLTLSTGVSSGSSTITVCSTDNAACGTVVATAGDASSVGVSLSTAAPTVAVGQSATVYVYGPSGVSYYVSSNSNPSLMQANLSGTTLTLTGIAAGSANVRVCASTGACATLTATITPAVSSATIALSQNKLALSPGQNATVTVSGGTEPYRLTGGTSAVAQTTLSGASLTIYAVAGGTSQVFVCSAGGACTNIIVTVSGTPAATASTPTTPVVTTPAAPVATAAAPTFTEYLAPGAEDAQVTALQNLLIAEGYAIPAGATGYYGAQTVSAVTKFQAAHNIDQLGVVGPATRTALNALAGTGASSASTGATASGISSMTLAELQAAVQSLEAQLTQVLSRIAALSGQ